MNIAIRSKAALSCVLTIMLIALASAFLSSTTVERAYADDAAPYTIVFDSNNGSGSMLPVSVDSLDKYTAPACTFSRGTDEFYAWNTKPDATGLMLKQGEALEGLDAQPGSTITLYAMWRIIIDNCTFADPIITVEGSGHVGEPVTITGYGDHEVDFSKPGVDGETVTRPIKIDVAVGTSKSALTQTVTEGQSVQFIPTRPVTYTVALMFQRWIYCFDATREEYSWHQAFVDNGVNQNWYIRVYQDLPVTAPVTLNANGGKVSPSTVYLQNGDSFAGLPTPMRSGYRFNGWMLGKTAITAASTANFDGVTSLALKADWSKKLTITLNANGGTCAQKTATAYAGSKIGKLPKAKRAGYAFKGWYTKKSGGSKVTAKTVAKASTKKLFAHWSKK